MAEEEQPLPESADGVDEALGELYGELLDINYEVVRESRNKAREMIDLRETFLELAAKCEEIAALHIRGAQIVSNTFEGILSHEWDHEGDSVETEEGEE